MTIRLKQLPPLLFLFAVSIIWIVPIFGIFFMSIRPVPEILRGWWYVDPLTITFDAWITVWERLPLGWAFISSLIVSSLATLMTVILSSAAAYAYQYLRFPGRRLTLLILINAFVLPNQVLILPLFKLWRETGLIDNYLSVILPSVGLSFTWSVFMVKVFLKDFPYSLIEAARIDGLNNIRTFFYIVLPNLYVPVSVVAILQFVWTWNDLLFPMLFLRKNITLPPLLARLNGLYDSNWDQLAVAAVITAIVPVVVFMRFRRYFMLGSQIDIGEKS